MIEIDTPTCSKGGDYLRSDGEWYFIMTPNYEAMSKAELRSYVLKNRDDLEAIRLLFTIPSGLDVKRYPPVCTEEGIPIEENIRIMEQAIRERVAQEEQEQ